MCIANSLAIPVLAVGPARAADANSAAAQEKIKLEIAYFGHSGSAREKVFVGFLRKHFAGVRQADLTAFAGKRVPDADVVILDYDGDYFRIPSDKRPLVSFQAGYDQPIVTLGVFGAMVSQFRGLKTGYL